jgi:hypothetical protein
LAQSRKNRKPLRASYWKTVGSDENRHDQVSQGSAHQGAQGQVPSGLIFFFFLSVVERKKRNTKNNCNRLLFAEKNEEPGSRKSLIFWGGKVISRTAGGKGNGALYATPAGLMHNFVKAQQDRYIKPHSCAAISSSDQGLRTPEGRHKVCPNIGNQRRKIHPDRQDEH